MRLIAVRGATTVESNSADEISEKTRALLTQLIDANDLRNEDMVSIIFTATDDLSAGFPATAARELGLSDVPLLGAHELAVDGAPKRCIRVLIHCYSEKARAEVRHIYLEGAKTLREDLSQDVP